MWSWVIFQKRTDPQVFQQIHPTSNNQNAVCLVHKHPCHWPLSWVRWIQITLSPSCLQSILILSSHLHLGIPTGYFLQVSSLKRVCMFLLCVPHAPLTWSSQQHLLRQTYHTARDFASFFSDFCTSSLLVPNFTPPDPFQNSSHLHPRFTISDHVPHP